MQIFIFIWFWNIPFYYMIYIFRFLFCTCSMYHSKTKNRQWILSVSSWAEKESRKEEKQENIEDKKHQWVIGRWFCLIYSFFSLIFQFVPGLKILRANCIIRTYRVKPVSTKDFYTTRTGRKQMLLGFRRNLRYSVY